MMIISSGDGDYDDDDDDIDNDVDRDSDDADEGDDDRDVALQVLAAQLFELLGAFLVLAPEHLLSWSSQLLVVYKDDADDEADDGDDNGDEVDNDDFQNVGTLFLNENMCWTGLVNFLLLLAKMMITMQQLLLDNNDCQVDGDDADDVNIDEE